MQNYIHTKYIYIYKFKHISKKRIHFHSEKKIKKKETNLNNFSTLIVKKTTFYVILRET